MQLQGQQFPEVAKQDESQKALAVHKCPGANIIGHSADTKREVRQVLHVREPSPCIPPIVPPVVKFKMRDVRKY